MSFKVPEAPAQAKRHFAYRAHLLRVTRLLLGTFSKERES